MASFRGLGAIFKISPDGKTVSSWITDPLLKGDSSATNPCKSVLGVSLGANGLALSNHAFYVANTDKASLIKIPIESDGTPGVALAFSTSDPVTCLPLLGADGLTADQDGTIFVVGNGGNSLVRVGVDGKASVLSQGGLVRWARERRDRDVEFEEVCAHDQLSLIASVREMSRVVGSDPCPLPSEPRP